MESEDKCADKLSDAQRATIGGSSFGWTDTWDLFDAARPAVQPEKLLRMYARWARQRADRARETLTGHQNNIAQLQRDIEAEEKDAAIWDAAADALDQREY